VGRWPRTLLAVGVGLSAIALALVGFRAVVEWRNAATLVATRRAESAADLLASALSRDMRGAHMSVLVSAEREELASRPQADLLHPVAGAFARYPYAEVFFSWQAQPASGVVFYSRTDRRPAWLLAAEGEVLFPVVTGSDRRVGRELLSRLELDSQQGRRFSAFNLSLQGTNYQAVAVISYEDALRERPHSLIGFLVNLAWVREHYFTELATEVAAIESSNGNVRYSIIDDRGEAVVGDARAASGPASAARIFPVAFFDPAAVAVDPPPDLIIPWWNAVATARDDPTLAAAELGARRTLAIAAVMTLTLAIGLFASLRAARARESLALMRADFVSAVTHELKTPLANLRALNETLASGRTTPEMTREYAQMGVGEATRLARLVDNILAYSRVADVADVYSFEPIALAAVVQRSLRDFGPTLSRDGYSVAVDLPDDLPRVRADPHALGLLLNNLLDNAIRYSSEVKALTISARAQSGNVTLDVSDRGIGIPADELERVTRKFVRGRTSVGGGSGLGLAIVERIVIDHGGKLGIQSTVGKGTTVSVTIPAVTDV
jgi:two-component system phosphate regulon sensor histidine kinase PhoR